MNVSDVKVWDAPSIGRNDGMSVETKCYQHVVIWADYAKALMKVEDERDEANRVCEQWRQWTVATRADNEALRARVAELEKALQFMLNVFGQDGLGDGAEGDAVEHARKALGLSGNKEGSRVDEEAKYNGALRDAHEWVESAARGAVDAHKVICPKCGKVFANGRGGCEGAQHGNFGCAMNNPYRLSVNESGERNG